jgi:hypothetical protein
MICGLLPQSATWGPSHVDHHSACVAPAVVQGLVWVDMPLYYGGQAHKIVRCFAFYHAVWCSSLLDIAAVLFALCVTTLLDSWREEGY